MPLDEQTWSVVQATSPEAPAEIPWMWIAIGAGGVVALVAGIALSRRKKKE